MYGLVRAEAALSLPMPEMIFGNNYLSVTHAASGFQLRFHALEALRHVSVGPQAARSIQVAYADDWARTRYVMIAYARHYVRQTKH